MSSLSYLFIGFTVVWAALFVYMFRLHRQGDKLRRDLDALKAARKGKQG